MRFWWYMLASCLGGRVGLYSIALWVTDFGLKGMGYLMALIFCEGFIYSS